MSYMSFRATRQRAQTSAYWQYTYRRVPMRPRESFQGVVCQKQLHRQAEQDWQRLHTHVCQVLPDNVHREYFLHQLEKLKQKELDGRRHLRPCDYDWVQHNLNDLVNNLNWLDERGQLYPDVPDIDMEVEPSLTEPWQEPLDRWY